MRTLSAVKNANKRKLCLWPYLLTRSFGQSLAPLDLTPLDLTPLHRVTCGLDGRATRCGWFTQAEVAAFVATQAGFDGHPLLPQNTGCGWLLLFVGWWSSGWQLLLWQLLPNKLLIELVVVKHLRRHLGPQVGMRLRGHLVWSESKEFALLNLKNFSTWDKEISLGLLPVRQLSVLLWLWSREAVSVI